MTADEWHRLSAWHAAWLSADADGRRQLRASLAGEAADLVAEFDALAGAQADLAGFLETPAFVLTANRLAAEATLPPGTDVGPYRIEGLVGHGGMGVVYRARDVRLDRPVALKMLSPVGVPDAAHVDRFVQEARLTASVDHPNIVRVFDVGVFGSQPYMVIELLDGETLRARLERGSLSIEDARRITVDIARGLAAAHAAGLVHRDLKPDNIVLTRQGVTKILDFGIAKLTSEDVERRKAASTLTGILLGTVGYLAPEQIRGDDRVDARADLFAVGSILYEMLTGTRAFAGENTVDTLHAILHDPAPDPATERRDAPAHLGAITRRLLAKAPADRFQSAADLVWALDQQAPDGLRTPEPGTTGVPSRRIGAWLWVAAALAIGLGGWWLGHLSREAAPAPGAARFSWALPDGTGLVSQPAVAPDGRHIAWVGVDASGTRRLYVRELSAADPRTIAGTEGARDPFWAPDSQALGFFAAGQLKRVAIDGGPPVELARVLDPRGGTWSPSGVIVYQPVYRDSPLMMIPASGGEPTPVTRVDTEREDSTHRYPAFLPDGRHFIYHVVSGQADRRGIYVASIDGPPDGAASPLFLADSNAVFVPIDDEAGVLLSVTDRRLTARRFDPVTRTLMGDASTIDVATAPASPHHPALVSASAGVLAFSSDRIPWGAHFASVGRDGTGLRVDSEPELGGFPRVSPDGQFVARAIVDTVKANPDIWIEDPARGSRVRVTTAQTFDVMPVWSPDGREIAYRSGLLPAPTIGFSAADASGPTRTLPCPRPVCEPTDWAPDDRYLVVNVMSSEVWALPLDGTSPAAPLFVEPFPVRDARISADGQWVAYVSSESGRPEVSVRSLAGPSRRYRVSIDGGDQPVWRSDGRELFFADPRGQLFAVTVSVAEGGLKFGTPGTLAVPTLGERHWGTTYDVTSDGQRVFFPHPGDQRPGTSFDVWTGWTTLLRR